jgi:hemerythrin
MIDLDWHDFYTIGVDFIDQEHKEILSVMRELRDAIAAGNLDECATIADSMIQEAERHFHNEEEYLAKVNYPGLETHKEYHAKLLLQAKQVKGLCERAELDHELMDCFNAMERFLIDDVLKGDVQFVSFLEYEGHIKRKFY